MVKGQTSSPQSKSTEISSLSQRLKVRKGSWSKVKAKFQPVKTLTAVADLPTALYTYVIPPCLIRYTHWYQCVKVVHMSYILLAFLEPVLSVIYIYIYIYIYAPTFLWSEPVWKWYIYITILMFSSECSIREVKWLLY